MFFRTPKVEDLVCNNYVKEAITEGSVTVSGEISENLLEAVS